MNNPQDSSNEFPEIDLSKIVPWPPSVPFDETPWNWTVEGSLAQWVFALEDALNSTDEEYQLIVRSLAKIQIADILHDDRYSVQHRVFMARCIYFVTSLVPENELLALVRSAQISVIPRNGRLNRETGEVELVLPPDRRRSHSQVGWPPPHKDALPKVSSIPHKDALVAWGACGFTYRARVCTLSISPRTGTAVRRMF